MGTLSKEEISAKRKAYYQANKEHIRAYTKEWASKPKNKEKKHARDKSRYASGIKRTTPYGELTTEQKERLCATKQKHYYAHHEQIREYRKELEKQPKHREKKYARNKVYRQTEKGKEANRRISTIMDQKKRVAKENMTDFDKFVLYEAASLRTERNKLTSFKWHIDHILPISKGGTNHYANIQLVPARWNLKKGNRTTERFIGV